MWVFEEREVEAYWDSNTILEPCKVMIKKKAEWISFHMWGEFKMTPDSVSARKGVEISLFRQGRDEYQGWFVTEREQQEWKGIFTRR